MTKEELLAEVEDVIRTAPTQVELLRQENNEVVGWLGRANAVIRAWDGTQGIMAQHHVHTIHSSKKVPENLVPGDVSRHFSVLNLIADQAGPAFRNLLSLLHEARYDLRMKTVGPLSLAISDNSPFDYFDEIRKIIEVAPQDLFFVDPYLDAEFVPRYLGYVSIRLCINKV